MQLDDWWETQEKNNLEDRSRGVQQPEVSCVNRVSSVGRSVTAPVHVGYCNNMVIKEQQVSCRRMEREKKNQSGIAVCQCERISSSPNEKVVGMGKKLELSRLAPAAAEEEEMMGSSTGLMSEGGHRERFSYHEKDERWKSHSYLNKLSHSSRSTL